MSSETVGQRPPSRQEQCLILHDDEVPAADESAEIPCSNIPSGQILAPTNFKAFYTLVEDTRSAEHHHPAVHYIFEDDDPDTVTNAILETLQDDPPDSSHRLVLVDVQADGKTIKAAQSLSTEWQISNVSVVPAPAWTEAGPETMREGGLMLKVQGAEAEKQKSKAKDQQKLPEEAVDVVQRIDADLERFQARLEHLQHIVTKDSIL